MITAEFKDFDDMMEFARKLVSTVETKVRQVSITPQVAEAAPTTPITTMQADFPQTQAAQVVQPAPVAPPVQQAAPVTPPAQIQPVPITPVQTYTPPIQQAPPVQSVATTTANYTADDLARAGTSLMDSGRQGDLLNLLGQFGIDSLVSLPPAQYGAFATALRGLGAPI